MSRRGFTLIELMVALAVAGAVVLVAERVFAATVDAGRGVAVSRRNLDREMNARRLLSAAFLSLEVGQAGAEFEGRAEVIRFATWLQTPDGWFERRAVVLTLEGDRLVLRVATGRQVVLAEGVASVDFDYLLEPGADAHWIREWLSPVSAPLAVRVRLLGVAGPGARSDTTIYLVKARG